MTAYGVTRFKQIAILSLAGLFMCHTAANVLSFDSASHVFSASTIMQQAPKTPLYKYFDPREDYKKIILDYVAKTAKRELAMPVHLEEALFKVTGAHVELTLETYAKDFKTLESVVYKIPAKNFKYPLKLKAQPLLPAADVQPVQQKMFKPYYESKLTYPKVTGLRNKAFEDTINATILADVKAFDEGLLNQAAKDYAELEPQGLFDAPYALDVSYIVQKNTSQLLSIQVIYWFDTGGAHGLWETVSYNYDLRTNKPLQLKDLFKGSYSYEKILAEKVKFQLVSMESQYKKNHLSTGGKASDYASPITGFPKVTQNTQFYMKDDQVVLYYSLYEILPYSFGTPNFAIPLKELQTGLAWQIY